MTDNTLYFNRTYYASSTNTASSWYSKSTFSTYIPSSFTGTADGYYTDYLSDFLSTTTASSMTVPYGYPIKFKSTPPKESSPEEIQRKREEDQRREIERQKVKEEKEKAKKKARELLISYLDEENKKRFEQNKSLEVESGIFNGIKYEIPLDGSKIKAIRADKTVSELCLSVNEPGLPMDDIILARFLHTMYDEKNMLKTAFHWNVKENLKICLN